MCAKCAGTIRDGKKSFDIDGGKKRREEEIASLRARKRDEFFKRARMEASEVIATYSTDQPQSTRTLASIETEPLPSLDVLLPSFDEPDPAVALRATILLRRMILSPPAPFQEVMRYRDGHILNRLIAFLTAHTHPDLQFEAAWILINYLSRDSSYTQYLVQAGVLPHTIVLLDSPVDKVVEQAIWALGNIAGDCQRLRDEVLSANVIPIVVRRLSEPKPPPVRLIRLYSWLCGNLCRGKGVPQTYALQLVPVIASLVCHPDLEVVLDAAWGCVYLSEIDATVMRNFCAHKAAIERLVALMVPPFEAPAGGAAAGAAAAAADGAMSIQTESSVTSTGSKDSKGSSAGRKAGLALLIAAPALRVVGNLIHGSDLATQTAIDAGALHALRVLLQRPRTDAIAREICWTISNISAGLPSQIQAVVDSNIFIEVVAELRRGNREVRVDAAWAIYNLAASEQSVNKAHVVQCGAVKALVMSLKSATSKFLTTCMKALSSLLEFGVVLAQGPAAQAAAASGTISESNPIAAEVERLGGVSRLEELSVGKNAAVRDLAETILRKYFGAADLGSDGVIEDGDAADPQDGAAASILDDVDVSFS